jgi:hypothetical protein
MPEYAIRLPSYSNHPKQGILVDSQVPRVIVRAGRRGGKTVGAGIRTVKRFLAGRRQLYAVPTSDQLDRWWVTVTRALYEPIKAGVFYKNETEHIIELPGTEQRIRGKTAWNADTLRGDYADDLTLDEWQLINEEAWEVVGAPMVADNAGTALFIYTPPSLHSRSTSKADDPQHAAKMYKKFAALAAAGDPRYLAFTFTSHDNPNISRAGLESLTHDMTSLAYRMEIMAEDVDEVPGALWTRTNIETSRVFSHPEFDEVVVAVDPTASSDGDECGIITEGRVADHYYTTADDSCQGSPEHWASVAIMAFCRAHADCIVAEKNQGGEMVEAVIKQAVISARKTNPALGEVPVKLVWASRGKATRAEPVAAIAEQGRDHHVGSYPALEDELCMWLPGDKSPNRLDAKVWGVTYLSTRKQQTKQARSWSG